MRRRRTFLLHYLVAGGAPFGNRFAPPLGAQAKDVVKNAGHHNEAGEFSTAWAVPAWATPSTLTVEAH